MRANYIFLDSTQDYPFEYSAGNTKVEILSQGLLHFGRKVYIINPMWGYNKIEKEIHGKNAGILYGIYPQKGLLGRLYNLVKILILLFRLRKEYKYTILTSNHFIIYIIECIWMKILGYKIGVLYHELRYTTLQNPSKYTLYSTKAFDRYFGYFCDFILPISHFLKNRCEKYKKPMLMTPVLSATNENSVVDIIREQFTYCGSAAYKRIIDFILDAYDIYSKKGNANLVLVLSGNQNDIQKIQEQIEINGLGEKVSIKQGLPYSDLLKLYSESLALLIPLDASNLQDIARFSQKIAEYTSTGRPIITNRVGEVPYYFDTNSAFIINELDVNELAFLFDKIMQNKSHATEIGQKGHAIFQKHFNNVKYVHRLLDFISDNYE